MFRLGPPIQHIKTGRLSAIVGKRFPFAIRPSLGFDRQDNALTTQGVRGLFNKRLPLDRCRIDGHFVRPVPKRRDDIFYFPNAAPTVSGTKIFFAASSTTCSRLFRP